MVRRDACFFDFWGERSRWRDVILCRVSTVDEVADKAKLTVANELVLLDIDMPRNICADLSAHAVRSGCGLPAGLFQPMAS